MKETVGCLQGFLYIYSITEHRNCINPKGKEMEGMKRVLLVLFIGALIAKEASAAQHVVGGSQGWVESADLNSWASGQTFKAGDQLGMFIFIRSCLAV